jgi:hypothetical protein
MIHHQVAFLYPALFLLGKTAEDLSQMLPQPFIQRSTAAFRDEGYVVFALPY